MYFYCKAYILPFTYKCHTSLENIALFFPAVARSYADFLKETYNPKNWIY